MQSHVGEVDVGDDRLVVRQREFTSVHCDTVYYDKGSVERHQWDVIFHADEVLTRNGEMDGPVGNVLQNGDDLFFSRACGCRNDVPLPVLVSGQRDLRAFGCGDVEGRETLYAVVVCGGDGLWYISEHPDEGIGEGVEGVVDGSAHVFVSAGEDMGVEEVFSRNAGEGRQP